MRPLVSAAHKVSPIGLVLANAEFDSERNRRHIREVIGAHSIIPAKRGKDDWKIKGVRAQMRRRFPRKRYSQRVQVESIFSVINRKLSAQATGLSTATQRTQAMLLGRPTTSTSCSGVIVRVIFEDVNKARLLLNL